MSRIEVLGFPDFSQLSTIHQQRLREIVASMIEFKLDDAVIEQAILVRKAKRITLADAIIATTALVHRVPLVTRNVDNFRNIAGLELINPFDPIRSPA